MLGGGFIGRFYDESLHGQRSRDRVVAIYARREETAKKFAADYGCAHWSTDMESVIAHPDVTMVCVALPNNLHAAAVALCAKHRKNVICTKPLGRTADEALHMMQLIEEADISGGYPEDLCYSSKFLKALETVRSGSLGRILWAKSREDTPVRIPTGSGTKSRRGTERN